MVNSVAKTKDLWRRRRKRKKSFVFATNPSSSPQKPSSSPQNPSSWLNWHDWQYWRRKHKLTAVTFSTRDVIYPDIVVYLTSAWETAMNTWHQDSTELVQLFNPEVVVSGGSRISQTGARTPGFGAKPPNRDCRIETPLGLTSSGGHWNGQYVSYWNAYLSGKIFAENCMKIKEIKEIGPGVRP